MCKKLCDAFEEGDETKILELLDSGADIQCQCKSKDGWQEVPLLFAAATDNLISVVKLLLSKGVDINTKDKYGVGTALTTATNNNHLDMMIFLLDNDADTSGALSSAAHLDSTNALKLLLDHGVDINDRIIVDDQPAEGAIHKAAASYSENKIEIIKYLISMGANINLPGRFARNTLFYAANDKNLETIKLLLEAGADKSAKDEYGKRAFNFADKSDKEAKKLLK